MKALTFQIKKWGVRTMMALGAALGFVSCTQPVECVYGPPPELLPDTEVVEDVYGPPMLDKDSMAGNDTIAEPRPNKAKSQ